MIRIAAAQINPTVGDLAGNQKLIVDYIRRAREKEADMVIFPELAICGYPPEDLLYKEHFVLDNLKVLRVLGKETKDIIAVIGFVDRDKKGHLYNAAAVVYKGKIRGVYHKEELPNYGVFDEKRYFQAGKNSKIFSIGGVPFGVNICEDIWVDRGIFQRQAKSGAKLIVNLSSSPYDIGKLQKRRQLLKKKAVQTKAFICYVNLVGGQDELVFDGSSFFVDPRGKIIASAKQFEEDLMVADLDVKKAQKRIKAISVGRGLLSNKKRAIKPHKAENLSQTTRIYKALVLGTRDYAHKNGFHQAVLGLSGGIDSALVAAIAVDALGKENVIGVTMPSQYNSKETRSDAKRLADNLGIRLLEVPIKGMYQKYLTDLKNVLKGTKFGLAEENLQARIRGNILMTLSNKFGWLVLTTGNKSEIAVGYCTLYGDMTGGFAVIKDVPKTKIYELARLRNSQEGKPIIPASVLRRAPSAELRSNQKDRDSLPSYEVLDQMLKEYVECHWPLAKMQRHNSPRVVKEVITMIDRSEYKRRQSPPGVKITPRAFGKDWRLPITNRYKESA